MEVRLHTRLVADPVPKDFMNVIQIGTTPCFGFDLSEEVFDFDDIFQLTFIFRQGHREPMVFKMVNYDINGDWELNDRFEYDDVLDTIRFTMTPEDTLQFIPSECGCKDTLVDFEVVVELIDGGRQLVFANKEDKIYVMDSLCRYIEV